MRVRRDNDDHNLYFVESESSSKEYAVRTDSPVSCTCTIFAIRRNKSLNKDKSVEVWCKHLEAVKNVQGLDISGSSGSEYLHGGEKAQALMENLVAEDEPAQLPSDVQAAKDAAAAMIAQLQEK